MSFTEYSLWANQGKEGSLVDKCVKAKCDYTYTPLFDLRYNGKDFGGQGSVDGKDLFLKCV